MHANEGIVHVFLTTPLRYVVYGLHFFFSRQSFFSQVRKATLTT